MANSNVDIANIALTILGEPPLTSLSGTQKAQTLCANNIDPARREVLSYHPWAITIARDSLNELAEAENLTDYKYVYAMPTKVLRILAIRPGSTSSLVTAETDFSEWNRHESSSYLIESGNIYTNAEDAYAQYIKDIENPALLPNYIADAVAANLARRISFALVQNAQVYQFASQNYNNAMAQALQSDARSQSNTPSPPTAWEDIF